MKVTLHTILGLKQVIGQRLTEIDLPQGSTVEDVLTYVKKRWGDKLSTHLFDADSGAVLPDVRIMVNGQTIQFLEGMKTPLKEGDEVLILPLVSGGKDLESQHHSRHDSASPHRMNGQIAAACTARAN